MKESLMKKLTVQGAQAIGKAAVVGAAHLMRNTLEKQGAKDESIKAVDEVEKVFKGIVPNALEKAVDSALKNKASKKCCDAKKVVVVVDAT